VNHTQMTSSQRGVADGRTPGSVLAATIPVFATRGGGVLGGLAALALSTALALGFVWTCWGAPRAAVRTTDAVACEAGSAPTCPPDPTRRT
jgi:hypothetical protein